MGWFQGIILGVVQGLTEFLPISSSGHLVLFQNLLGLKEPEVFFDICLHVGTLLAICIFFFQDLRHIGVDIFNIPRRLRRGEDLRAQWRTRPALRLAFFVLMGTIPTVILGAAIGTMSEACFSSTRCVGFMLVITGMLLAITKRFRKGGRSAAGFNVWDALLIGTAQGLAVLPGISRSGATISMGLFAGLDRDIAGRYSFILSIPAVLGAFVMQWEAPLQGSIPASVILVGTLAATLLGYASLKVLMRILRKGEFFYFAPYCWVLGAAVIGLSF